VNCATVSLGQYGRTVVTCSVVGVQLGEWLVRSGFALDWPQYSKGRYGAAQRDAERACAAYGRGATWHRGVIAPASARAGRRSAVQTTRTRIGSRQRRRTGVTSVPPDRGHRSFLLRRYRLQNALEHRVRICHVRFRGWNSSSTPIAIKFCIAAKCRDGPIGDLSRCSKFIAIIRSPRRLGGGSIAAL
jgi:hypothetical protein